jgi:hypothetical protein
MKERQGKIKVKEIRAKIIELKISIWPISKRPFMAGSISL